MIAETDWVGVAALVTAMGTAVAGIIVALRTGGKVDRVHATQREVKADLDHYNGKVEQSLARIESRTKGEE